MSKELSIKEQDLSEKAVGLYMKNNGRISVPRVQAFNKSKNQIVDQDIKVIVSRQHAWQKINILWEDTGLTEDGFHALGLWGTYSTSYSKMRFLKVTNQLKIHSSGSSIVILIDFI